LMGKSWSGFGYQRDDGKHVSGINKGEHKFSWINGDWADAYEKVKAAEKIERASIAAFIKLTPPKNDTVSPTYEPVSSLEYHVKQWLIHMAAAHNDKRMPSELLGLARGYGNVQFELMHEYMKRQGLAWRQSDLDQAIVNVREQLSGAQKTPTAAPPARRPLTLDESIALIWRVLKHDGPRTEDTTTADRLHWLNLHPNPAHFEHALNEGVKIALETFGQAWATVANELRSTIEHEQRTREKRRAQIEMEAQAAKYTPQPDQPTEPQPPTDEAPRDLRIKFALAAFQTAREKLQDYGELTGCFRDVPPIERALTAMIERLNEEAKVHCK